MLRSVFLDLDDTLLDFTGGEAKALRTTLETLGVDAGERVISLYHAINRRCWEQLEDGLLTRQQVLVGRFEQLFSALGVTAHSGREASTLYETMLSLQHDFLPGALETLQLLSRRYDLYLASNGTLSVQRRRLADARLQPFFRGIFISQEIGADKPSALFFQRCFASIPGFCPQASIMVGDSLTSDIRGGINAGIRTCWFNPGRQPHRPDIRPDYEISTLQELPPLLLQLES